MLGIGEMSSGFGRLLYSRRGGFFVFVVPTTENVYYLILRPEARAGPTTCCQWVLPLFIPTNKSTVTPDNLSEPDGPEVGYRRMLIECSVHGKTWPLALADTSSIYAIVTEYLLG